MQFVRFVGPGALFDRRYKIILKRRKKRLVPQTSVMGYTNVCYTDNSKTKLISGIKREVGLLLGTIYNDLSDRSVYNPKGSNLDHR